MPKLTDSPASTTFAWILDCGEITEKELSPADFGLDVHALELVTGGSAGDRATIFREILHSGKKRENDNALVRKALRNSAAHVAIKDYITYQSDKPTLKTIASSCSP